MDPQVDRKVGVLTERFVALWTFEGALACMGSPMSLQVRVSGETFPAFAAAVSLLTHQHEPLLAMDAVVVVEASLILATGWAKITFHEEHGVR